MEIHPEHLNTPRLIADATGTMVWRHDQAEPFGDSPADENPSGLGVFEFPLRFPGQYVDKESGISYNYIRDYDPGIGRYAQSDPIGLQGGLNTYAYAAGDPLSGFDPFGLEVRFLCRYLSGGARITNFRHCFVHVTCPEESWIKTFSLFRDDVVGSLGYKAENDARDNPAAPSAPITFNQPVTPSQSCAAPCAFEKAVVAKYRSFPSGPVPYSLFGPNSNSFARSLVTTTPFASQLPPGAPGPQQAPGIAQQMPGFPR